MKRLCSICARGGSKGVKNKNLRLINGQPLIAYTIKQARASKLFDCISVSSDSEEILNISKELGVDIVIKRPDDLASDSAGKLPAIIHCALESEKISGSRFDTFIDMDCTSPLRNLEDIVGVIDLLETTDAANIITGSPARRSPYFNLVEIKDDGRVDVVKPSNILRRQDAPRCFDMNASIYAWKRDILLGDVKIFNPKTKIFEMPEERSLDIDSEYDFQIVEFLLSRRSDNELLES